MILRKAVAGPGLVSSEKICTRCLLRLSQLSPRDGRREASSTSRAVGSLRGRGNGTEYFSANLVAGSKLTKRPTSFFYNHMNAERQLQSLRTLTSASSVIYRTADGNEIRAEKFKEGEAANKSVEQEASKASQPPSPAPPDPSVTAPLPPEHTIPPDASSRLSRRAATLPKSSLRRTLAAHLALAKPRLTFLMVLTTATAYSLYPVPELLLPSTTASPSLSALTLVYLTGGTALCSASANALNMLLEPEHDAKMSRTRNRPLVRGLVTKRGALLFAIAAGALGTAGLYAGVNATVAFLGAANIALYAGVYTPLKRLSVANTWVGAVVGAIPPLMGWAAAAGQSAAGDGGWRELLLGADNAGAWLLAALLFAWQFPHFNALSWTVRAEYRAAGYRMLAWVDERRNARVALRYALAFFPICAGLAWVGVTDRGYVLTSSVVNAWIAREAFRFWRHQGHRGTARALFWAGVWQLPGLMVLAMVHKKGLWDGVWKKVFGDEADEELEELWIEEGGE